jgi:3-oxoacyl-[acyl-carrier protein] reductase
MGMLTGKTAIVTGGSNGIGYAIGQTLAAQGAFVTLIGRDEKRLSDAAGDAIAAGGNADYIVCDLYKEDSAQFVTDEVIRRRGRIDVLVNDAMWWTNEPFFSVNRENFRKGLSEYLEATFFLTQAVAATMVAAKTGGRIIHIGSTAAFYGERGMSVYCTAKAAVVNMTRAQALELGEYGITVNTVAPGTTVTRNEKRPAHVLECFRKMGALPQLNTSQEIADAVAFMASDMSRGITGQTISVDGGCVSIRMPEKLFTDPILDVQEP